MLLESRQEKEKIIIYVDVHSSKCRHLTPLNDNQHTTWRMSVLAVRGIFYIMANLQGIFLGTGAGVSIQHFFYMCFIYTICVELFAVFYVIASAPIYLYFNLSAFAGPSYY